MSISILCLEIGIHFLSDKKIQKEKTSSKLFISVYCLMTLLRLDEYLKGS